LWNYECQLAGNTILFEGRPAVAFGLKSVAEAVVHFGKVWPLRKHSPVFRDGLLVSALSGKREAEGVMRVDMFRL